MSEVLRDLHAYVDALCRSTGVDAMTLQVCDRAGDRPRVLQILNTHGLDEAGYVYEAKQVFVTDPFADVDLNEQTDIACSDTPVRPSDHRIERQRERSGRYWDFLDRFDLQVEGVSSRRLCRGVYTLAGFLRRGSRGTHVPLPTAMLAESATVMHNMMGAELLRRTVRTNAGLMGLQRAIGPAPAAVEPGTLDRLSAREIEVARLVGKGRQSKQVAHDLGLSEHTIENHLRRIYGKLGIHNRVALAQLMN